VPNSRSVIGGDNPDPTIRLRASACPRSRRTVQAAKAVRCRRRMRRRMKLSSLGKGVPPALIDSLHVEAARQPRPMCPLDILHSHSRTISAPGRGAPMRYRVWADNGMTPHLRPKRRTPSLPPLAARWAYRRGMCVAGCGYRSFARIAVARMARIRLNCPERAVAEIILRQMLNQVVDL